jgi:crotonobetainyl-CoA:carnitine CoA-transferase CaiB-like acyl-CoA transferase
MGVFQATDGYVAIGVNSDSLFERLALAMGRPDLVEDPRYAVHIVRDTHLDEVDAIVSGWTSGLSVRDVLEALSPTGVPCGRVNTPSDILESSTAVQLSLFETVADSLGGTIRTPSDPFGFGNRETRLPRLGQDNVSVVQNAFASSRNAYEAFRERGAFGPSQSDS